MEQETLDHIDQITAAAAAAAAQQQQQPLSPGIKAIPSHDDDDDFDDEINGKSNDNNHDDDNDYVDGSSGTNSMSSSTSSTTTTSSGGSGGGGGGVEEDVDEGFVSGEEEFEVGSDRVAAAAAGFDETLLQPVSVFAIPRVSSVPIAKLSVDDEEEDVVVVPDDDDVENDGGFVGEGVTKVRVLGDDEEVVDEVVEGIESGGGVGKEAESSEIKDKVLDKEEIGQGETEEADDVVEEEEDKGEGFEGNDSTEVGAIDGAKVSPVVEEKETDFGSGDGLLFNDAGDSVVDSLNVDETEVVRSGVVVVGQVGEGEEDSEMKEEESLVFEKSSPVSTGYAAEEVDESKVASLADGSVVEQNDVGESNFAVEKEEKQDAVADELPQNDVAESKEVDSEKAKLVSVESDAAISGPVEEEEKAEADIVRTTDEPRQTFDEYVDVIQVVSGVGGEGIKQAGDVDEVTQNNSVVSDKLEKEDVSDVHELEKESTVQSRAISQEIQGESEDALNEEAEGEAEEGEVEGSATDGEEDTEELIFGSSAAARQFMEELVQASGAGSQSGTQSSYDLSKRVDGQIATDSDEEADSDEEGAGEELFDSAALAALLKAARGGGSDSGPVTITSGDGSRLFTIERPAGLGPSFRSVRAASRPNSSSLFSPRNETAVAEESLSEEEKKKIEKIQELRVKFLRLVHRLGLSAEDAIASQVLYRLALLAGRPTSQMFSLDQAKEKAMQLEARGKDDLEFSLNILVLGKTGVGKSATINSILGEDKVIIDAFEPATDSVKEIYGVVDGVKMRFYDTPGLKPSGIEQGYNHKLLASVKKFTKKKSPDIVLYVDRLDSQTRDLNDLPLLKTITGAMGPSIWKNTVVTLTHAASAPPDGPNGSPLSYEVFIAQRSHLVQQYVGQAVGEMRLLSPGPMNPVSLVENHPACRKNREGHKVLPNGQTWRPQLLLLCYSMKILAEAGAMSKPQDPFDPRKLFGIRSRLPLPNFLSQLLQPRAHPKLPDQGADFGDSDMELDDFTDSDVEEEEDEYDQLPPFKPLRNSQIEKLSKEQRKAYFEEYDYRVKLLQKQQLKEELKRMREMKKTGKSGADEYGQDLDQDNGAPATVQVPMPDMTLPPTFDGDNPAYRYRFLEPTSQFLVRPVLDSHSWDHDCGYDGVNVESNLGIADRFPTAVTVQVRKDKKDFSVHVDSSIAAKHGENGSSVVGFDVQAYGKQFAYTVRGETKFKTLKKNKTAAGGSVIFVGENVATGFKVEDQLAVGKRLVLVGSAGTVRSQKEAAYGANFEFRLKPADFPFGQDQTSFMLSLMKWRGDLAVGANLQSQISFGRASKVAVRFQLNNKKSGQITVKTSSSDNLQLALVGLLPIATAIYRTLRPAASENYSLY